MVNIEHLNFRFLMAAFFLLLAAMLFAGLYPFNFFPSNRVRWIPKETGLYFDGSGIAYTDRAESISLNKSLSIELLLKERRGSKNWGPKEIFSFYDGAPSPSLLVGQKDDGRIFIYSRFEKNDGHIWYRSIVASKPLSNENWNRVKPGQLLIFSGGNSIAPLPNPVIVSDSFPKDPYHGWKFIQMVSSPYRWAHRAMSAKRITRYIPR